MRSPDGASIVFAAESVSRLLDVPIKRLSRDLRTVNRPIN